MNARAAHEEVTDEILVRRLEAGELFLLPAARSARSLRALFDASQRAQGKRAWQAPHVTAWSSWTASLWSELIVSGAETRLLLNGTQEHSLWSDLIAALAPEGTLEQKLPSIAQLAQSGFALAAAWECLPRLRTAALTHDHRTFAQWAEAFQEHCRQEGLVPAALLERLLRQPLENGVLTVPSTLFLLNWTEFTPTQTRLLEVFEKRGTQIEFLATAPRVPVARTRLSLPAGLRYARTLAIAPNEREELLCAARWVRKQLETARTGPARNADFRVGVLLPGGPVPELEAVFREVLAPELQAVTEDISATPWEFSRNETLAAVPLITTALDLTSFCTHSQSLDTVSALLLSPYLGTEADREPNARFDAYRLRKGMRLRPEITLQTLAALISATDRDSSDASPAPWLPRLHDFAGQVLDSKLRRTFSEWMEVLRRLLASAGWPGPRTLSARENAAHRAWESTLDTVATLDFSGRRVSFLTAFEAVERQTYQSTLETPTSGAPVSVLSLQEAEGCRFDALVLLRGSEELWPPSRRTHSLLSIGLQRELRMPGTDLPRQRASIDALLRTCGPVLATCAEAVAEGRLRPAPLFLELGFEQVSAGRLFPGFSLPAPVREDELIDDVPLPPLPSSEVRGGARVLELQAACGFRAFAEKRLQSDELEAREPGLDLRDAGNLLHRSLENFWREVKSQSGLRAMSPERREALLTKCIADAVPRELQRETTWDHEFLDVQRYRLRQLLLRWVSECELSRAPFIIELLEQKTKAAIGPLELSVRIDRMDRLATTEPLDAVSHAEFALPVNRSNTDALVGDGIAGSDEVAAAAPANAGLVLVDYKSGAKADPKTWFGDRPDQPQLPLYAVLLDAPDAVKAITFAHIHATTLRYNGLESEPRLLGTKASALDADQIGDWRTVLTALAEDFSRGVSEVRPKDVSTTCKHCAQRLLCRIQADTTELDEDVENAAKTEVAHG